MTSRDTFRKQRVDEPVEEYNEQYEAAYQRVSELLEMSVDLTDLGSSMPEIVKDSDGLWRALCYLTGPPISDDDLKLLAEVELSQRYLKGNPDAYNAIRDTIVLLLDRKRFAWVNEERAASPDERTAALVSTAALLAAEKMKAIRRNRARALEYEVAAALESAGYTKVAKREVKTAQDWPAPGHFCGEGKVAERQADLIVTLFDGRYLPIECKVSASELNSIKRLNNDSIGKFSTWTSRFGQGQTLPVAVLEGAFAVGRLEAAQHAGAGIFWRHDLDALVTFLNAAH